MAQREPLFSILLPTHNRADVLPFAIRSVLAQTLQDFELLIVGDGCTDGTAEIVRGFSDPRIVWFDLPKSPNFGYANRNIALRQARGAYIAFMAHDDLWLRDHLELLLPFFERPGLEFAYSRPLFVIPEGMIAPGTFNLEYAPTLKSFLAKLHNWIPSACVVHRRECFAKYGYWNESLPSAGDLDMWTRIIAGGGEKNFAYLAEPTCLHFRANWHPKITPDVYPLYVWEQFHALEGFMPASLKIPVNGITEQEAFWQVMSAHSEEWTKQIRSMVWQVLDERVTNSNNLIGEMLMYQAPFKFEAVRLNQLMAGVYMREASLQATATTLDQQIQELLERQAALEVDLDDSKRQIDELSKLRAAFDAQTEHQAALEADLDDSKRQIDELSKRRAAFAVQIASPNDQVVEGSLAWKLIRRLRAIKRGLIPPGTLRERLWLRIVQSLKRIASMRLSYKK